MKQYAMTVLSPCFCAGADQSKPEIRAASVRGELRWWFRILGGLPDQEQLVFGGVRGSAVASKLQVRVKVTNRKEDGHLSGNLAFFTSGRNQAALFPGTEFSLHVNGLSRIGDEAYRRLAQSALDCFVRMGALGLRATRGAGAVNGERLAEADFRRWVETLPGVSVELLPPNGQPVLAQLEEWLKQYRGTHGIDKKAEDEFGFVKGNRRRRSDVLLRPIALAEGLRAAVICVRGALGR